jgi:hypothetical protein
MEKREHNQHHDKARPGRKDKQGKQAPAPQTPAGPIDAPHRAPPVRPPTPEDDRGERQAGALDDAPNARRQKLLTRFDSARNLSDVPPRELLSGRLACRTLAAKRRWSGTAL